MSLTVIQSGILDTIQDTGRQSYRYLGLNTCGVMDKYAAMAANFLVGNHANEAVLELHFPASTIQFNHPAIIALTGANFTPVINNAELKMDCPCFIPSGSTLSFKRKTSGARAYLSIYRGFNIPLWQGSAATHLKLKTGGFKGRKLLKNDTILFKQELAGVPEQPNVLYPNWNAYTQPDKNDDTITILPGPEWNWIDPSSKEKILSEYFAITNDCDRMGYRLQGTALNTQNQHQLISSAVDFGTIQLLPSGQLIVLMADHQTTGGYPRIAHVTETNKRKLAQKNPAELIQFRLTTTDDALRNLHQSSISLNRLQYTAKEHLETWLKNITNVSTH